MADSVDRLDRPPRHLAPRNREPCAPFILGRGLFCCSVKEKNCFTDGRSPLARDWFSTVAIHSSRTEEVVPFLFSSLFVSCSSFAS